MVFEIDEDDYLEHYGTPRHSGRYPWGSGNNERHDRQMNNKDFLAYVQDMRSQGLKDTEICAGLSMSTTQLRARYSAAKNEQKQDRIARVQKLRDKGWSPTAIGRELGMPEATVRKYLEPGEKTKADRIQGTASLLREQVAQKTYVDVGSGVERHLGISATALNTAVTVLQEEGYEPHNVKLPQVTTGKNTTTKVLCPPGTTWADAQRNRDKIQQVFDHSEDGGETYIGIKPPLQIHPDRVGVRYGSEGGSAADGVIFVRPGVSDVSLGQARYAQVRVAVGKGHYLKGMAMYKDDLPDGVDLLFNTNKENTGNKLDAMKPVSGNKDNPFGSFISRQITKRDANGNEVVASAMNIVHEEGKWSDWSNTISTQMLSKQRKTLVQEQLDKTLSEKQREFEEISSLTNPTVKKMLLEKFGDSVDSSAVHLEAAGFPRQSWHVILPVDSMPPTQIYAPNYNNGETVALIRFPHAGTFEIPELTVNNSHPEARKLLGDNPIDAVGIHHSVAERLSGADFDGDTVLVIPNGGRQKILATKALEGLKDFNPRVQYKGYPGMKVMTSDQKGLEMGKVSNLITDMTLLGAPSSEIVRAVRHSMVVIDAEKHGLDWKRSAIENNIADLKVKYQGGKNAGAATLISRATSDLRVPDRELRKASRGGSIDPTTGQRIYEPTGKISYKTGKEKLMMVPKLGETSDAHTLVSKFNTPVERSYADHSNKLKALANQARLDAVNTPPLKYSPSAAATYSTEVKSLKEKLTRAEKNRPLERQAQVVANTLKKIQLDANPDLDRSAINRLSAQCLAVARARTGATKYDIKIEPNEWAAIQAGAISPSMLTDILRKADIEGVKKLATPRPNRGLSSTDLSRVRSMAANGASRAEIANALGISTTTLAKQLKEQEVVLP